MPVFDIDLRQFLTPAAIARLIENAPPLKTPIASIVFKNTKQHPLPVIGLDEISEEIQNVPVVRRGSPAYPVDTGTRQITYIEPQPIEISRFLSAATLNNWKVLDSTSIEQAINNENSRLLQIARKTGEALCAQALTGSIDYQMKTDIGTDVYQITFGSTLSYTPEVKWDSTDASISSVLNDLMEMESLIQNKGWGGDIVVLAGKTAFQSVVKIANNAKNSPIAVQISDREVNIAGYPIRLINTSYKGKNGTSVQAVDNKKICMVDVSAPHTRFYLAIDDIDAGLVPLPFFVSSDIKKNPSGIELIGKSKPLPAPVTNAICWATVIS